MLSEKSSTETCTSRMFAATQVREQRVEVPGSCSPEVDLGCALMVGLQGAFPQCSLVGILHLRVGKKEHDCHRPQRREASVPTGPPVRTRGGKPGCQS